jgi:mono/diheme cytochrome c family protein
MNFIVPGKLRSKEISISWFVACLFLLALETGCSQKMANQPKYRPLRRSDFYEDKLSGRPLVEGTVPRGYLRSDAQFYSGKNPLPPAQPGKPAAAAAPDLDRFPFPITAQVLDRGENRYNIFCSPCHDRLGAGDGMVVRRGFRRPPSYHSDQLRKAAVGHFFDVITNGFGAMPDYAAQVSPRDRWAIAAYIRALQLSQNATLADVPAEKRSLLTSGGPAR